MPIHYCDVPIRQLLCNQSACEIIDATGKKLFENWNMDEFEKWIIRDDYSIFLQPDENKIKLLSSRFHRREDGSLSITGIYHPARQKSRDILLRTQAPSIFVRRAVFRQYCICVHPSGRAETESEWK